jgi:hypothetical protein
MAKIPNIYKALINNATITIELPFISDVELYYITTDNPLNQLTTDLTINPDPSVPLVEGLTYNLLFVPFILDYNGFDVYIFGNKVPDTADAEELRVTATYMDGRWHVEFRYFCCGQPIDGGNITPGTLDLGQAGQDNSATLRVLEQLPSRGLITGDGVTNRIVSPSKENELLVSTSEELVFAPVSGDIEMLSPGSFTLKSGSITQDKLAFNLDSIQVVTKRLTLSELLEIGTTPIEILPALTGITYKILAVTADINPEGVSFDNQRLYVGPTGHSTQYTIEGTAVSSTSPVIADGFFLSGIYGKDTAVKISSDANFTTGSGYIDIIVHYVTI